MSQRSADPGPDPGTRGRRRARYGAAALALAAVAGYVTFRAVTGGATAECTVRADAGTLALHQQQAANATTISAVASSRDLPERALAIALATSMQESKLQNIRGGDRDSLGLFQQRPSQGWGTAQQIMDPVYSADEFFDGLVKIPGYSRLPLTAAAQKVQHSGFPQAYAKHETDASLLAAALSGREPSLTCAVDTRMRQGDPQLVRQRLTREFGAQALSRPGGPPPGAGTAPLPSQSPPAAPADSRTVVVPGDPAADPTDEDAAQHGWVLAQWAVAHAPELRIAEVSYRGRLWRAADSGKGWRSAAPARGQADGDVWITVAR